MILIQVSNSNAVRAFEPENFVPSKYEKKANKLLKDAGIEDIELDGAGENMGAFAVLLMLEVVNEFFETHGHKDGTKKKDAHMKDDAVNGFVKSTYDEAVAAMQAFESNKKKLVEITKNVADAGGDRHQLTIRMSLLNIVNEF